MRRGEEVTEEDCLITQQQKGPGETMKSRQSVIAIAILGTLLHTAAAQPKKKIEVNAPSPETILAGTGSQSDPVLSDLIALKPEIPLGPQDVLKSYEIAMSVLAEKTSADCFVIVQARQQNQITRAQAEYLLQQSYQVAMMQYQVLSALHDVLKRDIDDASQPGSHPLKTASSDTVLVVPFPESTSASR